MKLKFHTRLVAGPKDARESVRIAIHHLESICFPDACARDLKIDGLYWWLTYHGVEPIAYAGLEHDCEDRGLIYRMGVLPSARGNGLQRRLILAMERQARLLDWSALTTVVEYNNPHSLNNFFKAGYHAVAKDTIKSRFVWTPQHVVYLKKTL